jgi:hypothetical protein
MKKLIAAFLVATIAVSGCSRIRSSKLNPFNWFGRAKVEQTVVVDANGIPQDPRPMVQQVTALDVARQPGGAIIRASGLPPTQGWWEADLLPENDGVAENGVLTYRFVVKQPLEATRSSTPQSRELTAAVYLSDIRLQDVSKIVVQGATNSLSTSR